MHRQPYWIGLRLTCPNCNTRIELEAKDWVHGADEPRRKKLFVRCPTDGCDELLYLPPKPELAD